eukprot:TRINITY_DN5748_c0_g1_i4.p1 TRINITY_DN5748_c0_g1~~TRINITY_DN5748_c0_g1_i4.p1  ORF type:complete len:303 (+),score=65.97 TRINITY_DN5748_c0_g1_i4:737-1645(+)
MRKTLRNFVGKSTRETPEASRFIYSQSRHQAANSTLARITVLTQTHTTLFTFFKMGAQNLQKAAIGKIDKHIWIYLIVMKMVGAAILNFVINFFIGWATWRDKFPVRIWGMPNTLAGDAFLTVVIQGILTFYIDGMATSYDVRKAKFGISPLLPPQWIHNSKGVIRWFFSGNPDVLEPGVTSGRRALRLFGMFPRALIYVAVLIVVFWPVTVGVIYGFSGDDNNFIRGFPTVPIFKGCFCAIMAFFQTVPVSLYAMMRKGWMQEDGTILPTRSQDASTVDIVIQKEEFVRDSPVSSPIPASN